MLDLELGHREVAGVARCESPANRKCGGRDQAVGLGQRRTPGRMLTAPLTGLTSFVKPKRDDSQPVEEPLCELFLRRAKATHDLFDVDGADVRAVTGRPKLVKSPDRVPAAKQVDQNGRV